MKFLSGSLKCYVNISFSRKQENADDIDKYLKEVFEEGYTKDPGEFAQVLKNEANYKPLGESILCYERKGK
jgi:hypothetical protein